VPAIDLVLGSKEMELTSRPKFLGHGYRADPYHKGKWVGEFRIEPSANRKRWFVVDLREKLQTERTQHQREIAYYRKQFAAENEPGAVRKLDAQARRFAEERFALAQAKLQRVNIELNGELLPPDGASTLEFEVQPMRADTLAEDAEVLAWVQPHRRRFPRQRSP
jgi:hypothetical protein